jgi:hypothetical protein
VNHSRSNEVLSGLGVSFRAGSERPNINDWIYSVYEGIVPVAQIDSDDGDHHFACGSTLLGLGQEYGLKAIKKHQVDDDYRYTLTARFSGKISIPVLKDEKREIYLPAKGGDSESSDWDLQDGKGSLGVFPHIFLGLDKDSGRKVSLSDLIEVSCPVLKDEPGSLCFVSELTQRIKIYITIGDFLLEGPAFPAFSQEENDINPLRDLQGNDLQLGGIHETLDNWSY